jgi:hypothetical protein
VFDEPARYLTRKDVHAHVSRVCYRGKHYCSLDVRSVGLRWLEYSRTQDMAMYPGSGRRGPMSSSE